MYSRHKEQTAELLIKCIRNFKNLSGLMLPVLHGSRSVCFSLCILSQLLAVLPLLDVDVVLHPSHPNNPNRPANINETVSSNPDSPNRPANIVFPLDLTFPEGSGFQWPCSVTAGLGDELQWFFNDRLIASTNESLEVCEI